MYLFIRIFVTIFYINGKDKQIPNRVWPYILGEGYGYFLIGQKKIHTKQKQIYFPLKIGKFSSNFILEKISLKTAKLDHIFFTSFRSIWFVCKIWWHNFYQKKTQPHSSRVLNKYSHNSYPAVEDTHTLLFFLV